jgi:4'-phosphopantetheinyl transferase
VWLAHLGEPASMATLSASERDRAQRFAAGEVRRRFVTSHTALRDILSRYCDETPGDMVIEAPERGKPRLPQHPYLSFNLSHAGDWALVAVAHSAEIGIDLEEIREDVRVVELAQRFLAPAEAAHLAGLHPGARIEAFFRFWTCKEAFVKALGRGFDLPLRRFTVALANGGAILAETAFDPEVLPRWDLLELSPLAGFRAAACLETGCQLSACWRWVGSGAL